MSIVRVLGFETGLASCSSAGDGIFDSLYGSAMSIQSTVKRTGSYALRAYQTSGATSYVEWVCTDTVVVGMFYFRWHTATSAAERIVRIYTTAGSAAIKFDPSDQTLLPYLGSNGTKSAALTQDTWYKVEYKYDSGASPQTLDLRVGGVACPQKTYSQTCTPTYIAFGFNDASTGDIFFDDMIHANASGDYPFDADAVIGIRPNADGTHNAGTNVIEDQSGNDIGVVTAYNLLDDDPWNESDTDYVRQVATGVSNYAEVNFEDTSYTSIYGAKAYLAYKSSGTTANEGGCIIIDEDATQTEVWGTPSSRADYSESSMFFKGAMLPTPAGGWDQAAVNALKARIGYSNNVATYPYWHALIIEVAVSGEGSSSSSSSTSSSSTSSSSTSSSSTTSSSTTSSSTTSSSTTSSSTTSSSTTSSSTTSSSTTSSSTTSSSTTSSSTSSSSSITVSNALAFGEENPTMGETPVSWQTWSDGAGGTPTIQGDPDWGKLELILSEEGRSDVYDFLIAEEATYTLTQNRYGTGSGTAKLQIRGDTSVFSQDDVLPDWETYTVPILRTWRYVQVRQVKDS